MSWPATPPTLPRRPPEGAARRPSPGKARSARNALKHGLRARLMVLLKDEGAADFAAFEAAMRDDLAPAGAFEAALARIVAAAWRWRRADRMEAALLDRYLSNVWPNDGGDLQIALAYGLMRDGNGPRALDIVARYRGSVLAELFRSLAALEARQAGAQSGSGAARARLSLTGAKTKRIRETTPRQRLGISTTQKPAS